MRYLEVSQFHSPPLVKVDGEWVERARWDELEPLATRTGFERITPRWGHVAYVEESPGAILRMYASHADSSD